MSGTYAAEPGLHDDVLGLLVRAYDVYDRRSAEARSAAAAFLWRRSDLAAAVEEVEAALALNPHYQPALILFGEIQLSRFGFAEVEAVVAKLRRIDPASREADVLEARALLKQRRPDLAPVVIRRLLASNANSREALMLQAAAQAMRLEDEAAAATLARLDADAPNDHRGHLAVGQFLAVTRQYERAADALREAVARAPWAVDPRKELGEVLAQAGLEPEAIATLREARRLDPFDARVKNYLQLLEEIAGYARIATRHFEVRHAHAGDDAHPAVDVVASVVAERLDPMHAELSADYRGFTPAVPTSIQIYPTHDRFSVRVAGDPYVGTVGACTGPVIALVAPRGGKDTLGAFDWERVMRHEYVHTLTLGMTDNRIWHWYTEGLAVRAEQAPPRQVFLDLIGQATREGELFPLEGLTWGFVRPRKPTDRTLAYAQSWLVCEYLVETHGEEVLLQLLDACAAGLTEREAWPEVLDQTPEQFDRAFASHMREVVAEWGHDEASTRQYAAVMQLATAALRERDYPKAVESLLAAREIRPLDELPLRRLAACYLQLDRPAEAADALAELARRSTEDGRFATRAARLYLETDQPARALEMATLANYAASYERASHELLREAAEAAGETELAARVAERLEAWPAIGR
jgi:tetratricopeptide (TPR) repeat protein